MSERDHSETVEADVLPCPFCRVRPRVYVIHPHVHHFVDLVPFAGGFYIECVACELTMMDAELFDLVNRWNTRFPHDDRELERVAAAVLYRYGDEVRKLMERK